MCLIVQAIGPGSTWWVNLSMTINDELLNINDKRWHTTTYIATFLQRSPTTLLHLRHDKSPKRERDFPSVHEALSGVVGRRRTRPRSFVGLGKDRRRLGRIFWDLPGSFWILSDLFGSCRTNVGLVGLLSDAFQIPILDSDSGFWFWIRTLSSDSSDSDSGFWLWILILRILAASSFRATRPEVGA